MNRTIHVLALLCAALLLGSCSEFKLFTDRFLYFNVGTSSSTSIDCEANVTCQYMVHYSGTTPEGMFTVTVDAVPGAGLEEGVDYEITTSRTLTFLPGVFEMPFRIKWISHPLDREGSCSLVLTLKSCSDDGVNLGYPGPASSMKSLTIIKY